MNFNMTNLRDFQRVAKNDLLSHARYEIKQNNPTPLLLHAPTGSGKTVIIGQFLKEWIESQNSSDPLLSFIWLSVRSLPEQSYNKINPLSHTSIFKCTLHSDRGKEINQNEIIFVPWQTVSHKKNKEEYRKSMRKTESGKDYPSIIKRTRKQPNKKIILIVDEAHLNLDAEGAKEVLAKFKPDMFIFMTATPNNLVKNYNTFPILTKVPVDKVIEAQMIKKELPINYKWFDKKKRSQPSVTTKKVILRGLEWREELVKKYKKNKIGRKTVNPLLIIQLPQKGTSPIKNLQQKIEKILAEKKITYENKKLALWMSDDKDKRNLDDGDKSTTKFKLEKGKKIEDIDNEVEVLIFKEAIATGWDCPRAHVMCLFREQKNMSFTFQVIGRIMRMPELKHYPNDEELNRGYIFTNLPEFELEEHIEKTYVPEDRGELDEKLYNPIHLKSIHIKRQRSMTRFNTDFYNIFTKTAKINKKMKSLNLTSRKISSKIIQGVIGPENYGLEGEVETIGSVVSSKAPDELPEHFQTQIADWCKPYHGERSHELLFRSLLASIEKNFGITWKNNSEKIIKTILTDKNKKIITECTDIAKEKYANKQAKLATEKPKVYDFEILENGSRFTNHAGGTKSIIKKDATLSVEKPLYDTFSKSVPERAFYKKLNNSKNVAWWWKNGYGDKLFFATPYKLDKRWWRFFPDYIVQWTDGTVGIYDTKGGMHIDSKETKLKAKSLADTIKNQNKNRTKFKYKHKRKEQKQKLEGGIIANTDSKKATGDWKINKDAKQPFDKNKISEWDDFTRF